MKNQKFDLDYALNMDTDAQLRAHLERDDLDEATLEAIENELEARTKATPSSILSAWSKL